MPYDDEMQVSLHPKMASWLQNELENGRFEVAEEGDDKILDDTLKQIQPAPEPSAEEVRAKEGEQALRRARNVLQSVKFYLNTCAVSVDFPFHEIDAAHGILQDEMIPLAREFAASADLIAALTTKRNKLTKERDDLRHANEALKAINDQAMQQMGKLEMQTPSAITVRAKDEMWAILNVDNQTDALQCLRTWKQMIDQRRHILIRLGVDNGYDAYQTINRLRNFLHALSERKGENVTKPQMDEYVLIASKLIYALNRRSSEG